MCVLGAKNVCLNECCVHVPVRAERMSVVRQQCSLPSLALIDRVVRGCGFQAMKTQFEAADAESVAAGKRIKKNHIRQGKAGGWRSALGAQEISIIDTTHA